MVLIWLHYSPKTLHTGCLYCKIYIRYGLLDWPCTYLNVLKCVWSLSRLFEIALIWSCQGVWRLQHFIPKILDKLCKIEFKPRLIQLAGKRPVIYRTTWQKRLEFVSTKNYDCFDEKSLNIVSQIRTWHECASHKKDYLTSTQKHWKGISKNPKLPVWCRLR